MMDLRISAGEPDEVGPLHLHGVLVEIFDTGVLILGESGIGKSETALELVRRGHRLVADDAVTLMIEGNRLTGRAPELTFELIEISGLGIQNVRTLFGPRSVASSVPVDLWIGFVRPDTSAAASGPAATTRNFLGRQIPGITFALHPGRDLATLVETAVRVFKQDATLGQAGSSLAAKHNALIGNS